MVWKKPSIAHKITILSSMVSYFEFITLNKNRVNKSFKYHESGMLEGINHESTQLQKGKGTTVH